MKRRNLNFLTNNSQFVFSQRLRLVAAAMFAGTLVFAAGNSNETQGQTAAPFRIGERLTYNVAFGRFDNVAYAELYTVSRGKLSGTDAIEIRSTIKTFDLVGAALYPVDESRTTFVSVETGYPLYVSKTQNNSVAPKETVANYLSSPASTYDLLTMIAKVRDAGGVGAFSFTENEKIYAINFLTAGSEKVKTNAGDFDTVISTADSEYLAENGITDLKINLSSDERKIPVMISFKTKKGSFRAVLAGIQTIEPEVDVTPTPTPATTPIPVRTPKPVVTPTPYVDNQPLSEELPFALGETLDYQVSTAGRPLGVVSFQVKERKQFMGDDSLLLTASVKGLEPGVVVFDSKDSLIAYVNPESLAPQKIDLQFRGGLSPFNQTAQFDQKTGIVTFGAGKQADVPVGTHSVVSLLYAIRTFNLKRSKDSNNPINDTRVAVFWDSKAYVFSLRPSDAELITLRGEKISAQLIAINTGIPQLDQRGLKIWLSNGARRVPLRIAIGDYQADLISGNKN